MASLRQTRTSRNEQVERFQQVASDAFAPMRIRPTGPGPDGELRGARPGGVLVTRIVGGPCVVRRSRALIGSGDRELVKVALHGRGRAGVQQDGRQCLPGAGDLVVYETVRPYELRFWEPFDLVVLGIPRPLFGGHLDRLAARTASVVPTDGGGRRLAALLLREAAGEIDAMGREAGPHLADALVSVVLSALAEQPVAVPGQDDLGDRLLTYCLGRLHDPGLTPASVARAHHVSLRYLHKVLGARGLTPAAWIRRQRLERIRRDLADPALAGRSVAAIAARWGVLDAAHLSRALRAEFGRGAAEIRKAAYGPRSETGSGAVP